jgi:DNA-binding PadR family transcriptional regulator
MSDRPRRPATEAFIPLSPVVFDILLALSDDERHGYAIMQAVSEMSDGREAILPGTLYAALARMVDEGLVEVREADDDDPTGGPKRRYYRRTKLGKDVARAESERLRALLDIAVAQKIISRPRK